MLIVSDAVPGPPCVIAKMMSKLFTASIIRIIAATNRNGATSGRVMCRNICQIEAPSICALS